MPKNMDISFLLDFYGDMLTVRQRDMIELYYNNDLSLAEIAENLGISRQGVRDAIKRAEGQLLEMEERLGLCARFRVIRGQLSDICAAAEEICEINNHTAHHRDIEERAKKILALATEVAGSA